MEEDTGIDEAKTYTVEKSEKVEPEKDGLSQFRDEEKSLGADMEDLHDETVRETLGKDQVQGVRENSSVEPNVEDVLEVNVSLLQTLLLFINFLNTYNFDSLINIDCARTCKV
jgi:large subunit ribosomal protein L21